MSQLFGWLRASREHPLIASSIFHYEFEFIHPFSDGNGRMGRLWQSVLLSRWNPAFAWLPVETLVHQNQAGYYRALKDSTEAVDCAPFIRFMLGCIHDAAVRDEMTGKTTGKVTGEVTGKMPDKVLALLAENPQLTVPELAALTDKSVSSIHRAIRTLRESGHLRRIGPDKGGYWEVIRETP